MARKKNVNHSQKIRDYIKQNPTAKAPAIAKELGVSPGLVYQVKSKLPKNEKDKPKRGRPPKSLSVKQKASTSKPTEFDAIHTAAELVTRCGSIEAARKAIDAVESVSRIVN